MVLDLPLTSLLGLMMPSILNSGGIYREAGLSTDDRFYPGIHRLGSPQLDDRHCHWDPVPALTLTPRGSPGKT